MQKLFSIFTLVLSISMSVPAQNVGIGTNLPRARLHVVDNSVLFSADGTVSGFPIDPPISGMGRRMMWYAEKAAFRTGFVNGFQWDNSSIGVYSFASGYNTTASERSSTAFGHSTIASGGYSTALGYNTLSGGGYTTAMGNQTIATGDAATAMGYLTLSSGNHATAMGYSTDATGNEATAMGYSTVASGTASTAMGWSTDASGTASTAMGIHTTASGYAATAMGDSSTASGYRATAIGFYSVASGNYATAIGTRITATGAFSIALGRENDAIGDYSLVLGRYSKSIGYTSTTIGYQTVAVNDYSLVIGRYNDTTFSNHLFEIGNGNDFNNRSNALVVRNDGNTGIGVNNPLTKMDIGGDIALRQSDKILVNGINNNILPGKFSFINIIGPTAAFTLSGFQNGSDGKILTILNMTTQNMTISNLDVGSDPENRINTLNGSNLTTNGNGLVTLQYSAAHNRWMVIAVRD